MNPTRIWTIGATVAIVAIFGAAAALGVQPHLAAAAAADESTQATEAQNASTTTEIARLTRVAATQSTLEKTESDLDWAVPPNFRMNSFSKMLRDAAALNGVKLTAFDPTTPTVYAPVAAAAPAPAASTGGSAEPTSTPTPSAAPAAPAADSKSPWFGVSDPAITAGNFTVVPVTVTVEGPAAGVVAFAGDVQEQRRLFAVTTVSTQYDKTEGVTTGTVAGYVYTLAR